MVSERITYIYIYIKANLLFFPHMGWYNILKKAMVFNIGTINIAKVKRRNAIDKWVLIIVRRASTPLHRQRHSKSWCGDGARTDEMSSSTKSWSTRHHEWAGVSVLAFVSGHHNAWIIERSLNSFLHIT